MFVGGPVVGVQVFARNIPQIPDTVRAINCVRAMTRAPHTSRIRSQTCGVLMAKIRTPTLLAYTHSPTCHTATDGQLPANHSFTLARRAVSNVRARARALKAIVNNLYRWLGVYNSTVHKQKFVSRHVYEWCDFVHPLAPRHSRIAKPSNKLPV